MFATSHQPDADGDEHEDQREREGQAELAQQLELTDLDIVGQLTDPLGKEPAARPLAD